MTIRKELLLLSLIWLFTLPVRAQENGAFGAYSPYSIYGIGDLSKVGSSLNKGMGGVGISTRNRRFINFMNPAAVTARDSSTFMADFGLEQKNKIFKQNDIRSGNNTFNVYNFVMSFPIYRSSAFMVGITPFSDLGYSIKYKYDDQDVIGNAGNVSYDASGDGSMYQVFVGAGVTLLKRLSVGAQFIYYFGNIEKNYNVNFSQDSYSSIRSGYDILTRGATGKIGVQYQQPIKNDISLLAGATYRFGTKLKGSTNYFEKKTISGVVDTVKNNELPKNVRIVGEFGLGVSVKKGEKWSVEVDYLCSNWKNSHFDDNDGFRVESSSNFSSTMCYSLRAGFEIIPNRNDIRYYLKRCTYRAGVYYDRSYFKVDGNMINSLGVTFGFTLPVFRGYNGISFVVDAGQRGILKGNIVRERYVNFVIGFNIFDIWFQKPRYN